MQVEVEVAHELRMAADQGSLGFRIILDHLASQDGFDHVCAVETFLDSMLDCMALDQIPAFTDTLADIAQPLAMSISPPAHRHPSPVDGPPRCSQVD